MAASLFAKKGYNGVGVAEIGAASGLVVGHLPSHREQEGLLHEIASQYISELLSPVTGLQESIQILFALRALADI